MLLCFGVAWPFSIWNSYKARCTKGKSVHFLWIVWVGYISGIIHKLLNSNDFVIAFYLINTVMVTVDIGLFYRNRRIMLMAQPGA